MKIIRKTKNIKLHHIPLKYDVENNKLLNKNILVDNETNTIYTTDLKDIYMYQNKIQFIHDTTILKIISNIN
jgi:hypothetical protein